MYDIVYLCILIIFKNKKIWTLKKIFIIHIFYSIEYVTILVFGIVDLKQRWFSINKSVIFFVFRYLIYLLFIIIDNLFLFSIFKKLNQFLSFKVLVYLYMRVVRSVFCIVRYDSNSELNITSLQSIIHGLKYKILHFVMLI